MALDLRVRLLGHAVAAATGPMAGMTDEKRSALRHPSAPQPLVRLLNGRRAAGVTSCDVVIPGAAGGVPARVYRPPGWTQDGSLPLVVAFHGGGFVFGDLQTGEWLCSSIAREIPAVVVSVAYRLAPEHPAPAAQTDAVEATSWVAENARRLGGRADRLAVFGDSSGGTLAAGVAVAARNNGGPPLAFQALAYPITDLTLASQSIRAMPCEPLLRSADLRAYLSLYLGEVAEDTDPALSPMHVDDLSGLPPSLILIADHDPLRDDGHRYADRLSASGVAVELVEFRRSPHGFFSFPGICRAARPALDLLTHSMREELGDQTAPTSVRP